MYLLQKDGLECGSLETSCFMNVLPIQMGLLALVTLGSLAPLALNVLAGFSLLRTHR